MHAVDDVHPFQFTSPFCGRLSPVAAATNPEQSEGPGRASARKIAPFGPLPYPNCTTTGIKRDFSPFETYYLGMNVAALPLVHSSEQENAAIMRGLRRQDPDLLDRLIETYQHRLLRYLVYLTNQRDLAEDLFQETWMRVLERGAQYNGKAKFETWLFAIARHLVIDWSRKKSCASLDVLQEFRESERPFEISSDEPTPFDQIAGREDGARVAFALSQLDTLHREVLVLRFHEELSLEEIASVVGAPLSTVKSRLYRGLGALRPKLEDPAVPAHV
jgi:RNA polymerase sigma-70 factor (ECF subfamily)